MWSNCFSSFILSGCARSCRDLLYTEYISLMVVTFWRTLLSQITLHEPWSDFYLLHTGRHEGAEACHFDGRGCHRHIWFLLGCQSNRAHFQVLFFLHSWCPTNRCCQHNGLGKFSHQPVCIRPAKPTVQGEDERNDLLQGLHQSKSSSVWLSRLRAWG